jgi:hypothetical protein
MPQSESDSAGYTLLLYRTKMGLDSSDAYTDALHLLERGANPNLAAVDGMTLAKMLTQHRKRFETGRGAPAEFAPLWEWAQTHGIVSGVAVTP